MASTLTNLLYHSVFSTKNRGKLITEQLRDELYRYIGGIIKEAGGLSLEIGGMSDHLHVLARFPPRISISDMLQNIKGGSSRWVSNEREPRLDFRWQKGYAAFSVSPSQVPKVKHYIRTQDAHHKEFTFREEYLILLDRHEIEYDEQYVFD
ncbi:MAG: IS200/IS605 family transposase [Gammaproteobacteria bacterium]|nr:IS200/IS605 family transposase [Gammaproteobacteria bacterium]MCP4489543.1 IS200/IS605 family transposase [Gammaproteobacteria bacterium]